MLTRLYHGRVLLREWVDTNIKVFITLGETAYFHQMENDVVGNVETFSGMSVDTLVRELEKSSAGTSGALAHAASILEEMTKDAECIKFLSFTGPLVPGGLGGLVQKFIEKDWCNVIVTSGASIVHDVMLALGGTHLKGTFSADDAKLKDEGFGRIGNVYAKTADFEKFETFIQEVFAKLAAEKRIWSVSEVCKKLGGRLDSGILHDATKNGVPIFCPAIADSMLGLQLFMFNNQRTTGSELIIDSNLDAKHGSDLVFDAKKTGALILGGGVVKHYTLGANILRGGLDYGINVTTGTPYDGSLSGARLEEGISWGKVNAKARLCTIYGDYFLIFPILAACLDERMSDECGTS